MTEEIEDKVLDFLSQDNILKFLVTFKNAQEEYNAMKKMYAKRIKDPLKEIVGDKGIKIENDIFRVAISQPQVTEKFISITKARKLPKEIRDKILIEKMSSPRMVVTLIEDETDDEF